MRKLVEMTFIKGKNTRGYMGHWIMNYYVENVIDLESNEKICDEYVFKNSKIFKGMKLKLGDKVRMRIKVDQNNNKVKLYYYSDVKKM